MSAPTARLPITLVALTLAAMGLFYVAFDQDWFDLGIPGEWIWPTPDVWSEATSPWLLFLPAAIAALVLAVWAAWGAGHVESWRRWQFLSAVVVCMVFGALFQFFCEVATPNGLQKWAALHSYSANGFHAAAVRHAPDLPAFFTNHAAVIRDHHPHHLSVNPPGWVLVYGGLLNFFAAHPDLAQAVYDYGAPNELPWRLRRTNGTRGVPLNQQATLVTIAVGSRLICFLSVLPAAWLAAMRFGRQAALAAASAVLLLPAVPLFAPHRDTVYPTVALTVLALSHYAWEKGRWQPAALAGVLLGVGTFFSMCFFTIGGLAALYVAAQSFRGKRPTLASVAAAPLGWLTVVLLIQLVGHNSWTTWAINLAKNREFNQLYRQSYGAWTVANVLEFAVALGLPLVIFLGGRIAALRRVDPLLCAWAAIIALLDVAGTNRGESCRLWLFMMPVGALLAVEWLPQLGRWFRPMLVALVVMQAFNCVMLDRDLLLFTDLELSQARQETGLWKLQMTERGFGSPNVPAAELFEAPDGNDEAE